MGRKVSRYPLWFRERVMSSAGSLRRVGKQWQVSPRTLSRWRRQLQLTGNLAPGGFSPGRPRKLSLLHTILLGLFKLIFPDALLTQCISFLNYFGAQLQPQQTSLISRNLKMLGFTKKKLCHINVRRNEEQRKMWWILRSPYGVADVPRARLIDIDETGVVLFTTERGWGHALRGQRAVTYAPPERGKKYTVILAISNHGVVSWLVVNNNTNTELFVNFIRHNLHPALGECGHFLMMDNLSAHHTAAVVQEVKQTGHQLLFRPPYSLDYAPVELAFKKVKTYLRSHKYEISPDNLESYIHEAIGTITPEDCNNWFKKCFY